MTLRSGGAPIYRHYRWVDESGYRGHRGWLEHGICPVIAPGGARQRRAWAGILAWYGMSPGDPVPVPPRPRLASHLVVSVGTGFLPAAQVLARASGRPLAVIPELDAAYLPARVRRAASVVLVGPPTALPADRVAALAPVLSGSWGVLTARDPAAISLVVAKQLGDVPDHCGRVLLADAIVGSATAIPASAAASSIPWPALGRRLLDPHRVVVLHAHGEGGHVNLGTLVLCGQPWGRERLVGDGAVVPDGCCTLPGALRCKRAGRATALLGVGAVRAEQLCLLSCNGFAVGGELYPSEVSCVLAAAEGHQRAALVTDRPLGFERELPGSVAGLLGQGEGLDAVWRTLNDLELRRSGTRPFVLCGDPWLLAARDVPGEPRSGRLVERMPLPASRVARVVDTAGAARLRGTGSGLGRAGSGPCAWRSRDPDWRRQSRWLAALWRRAHQAQRWLLGIRAVFAPAAGGPLAIALDAVEALAAALLRAIAEQAMLLERIRGDGLWDQAAVPGFDLILIEVARWDRAFAALLDAHLLSGDLIGALIAGQRLAPGVAAEDCPRCRGRLRASRAIDPFTGRHSATWTHCRVCGSREWRAAGGIRLALDLPARVAAGAPLRVVARDLTSAPLRCTPMPRRQEVVHLREKAGGGEVLRMLGGSHATLVERVLTVPARCAPDLHTVLVAWVHGLSMTVVRQRVACVGRGAAAAAPGRASGA